MTGWYELTSSSGAGAPDGRPLWPDLLKLVSIYAVVLIHTAAPFLVRADGGGPAWWAGNLYDSAARWCIPVFFMASGAFLLGKASEVPLGSFFRRRVERILVPFLLWSFAYFVWRVRVNGEDLPLSAFVPLLLTEPIYYHLWYLYVLAGLYLFAPLLAVWLRGAGGANVRYFVALWFVLASVVPTLEWWFGTRTYLSSGASVSLFKYSGYFVLGYALRRVVLRPAGVALGAAVFLLALAVTAWGTHHASVARNGGLFDPFLYEYFSVNVLLMALPVFLVGKSLPLGGSRLGSVLLRAGARCVPGVYLLHALVIAAARRGLLGATLDPAAPDPALGIPLFALAICAVTFPVVLAVKSVPIVRHVFP